MQWFTLADLHTLFGWSPRYVYKLACVHQWRSVGRAPVRYASDDVLAYRCTTRPPKRLT
jgi:hypothetical protein